MTYIIKTMSGSIIEISEEKYKKIRMLTKGLVHLDNGVTFNLSSVDSIIPEKDYNAESKNSGEWKCKDCGRLHPRNEKCGCHGGRY